MDISASRPLTWLVWRFNKVEENLFDLVTVNRYFGNMFTGAGLHENIAIADFLAHKSIVSCRISSIFDFCRLGSEGLIA